MSYICQLIDVFAYSFQFNGYEAWELFFVNAQKLIRYYIWLFPTHLPPSLRWRPQDPTRTIPVIKGTSLSTIAFSKS